MVIDVIGTVKNLLRWVLKELLFLLALIAFALAAPLLCTVGIVYLAVHFPDSAGTWGLLYLFLFGPIACTVWMLVIGRWNDLVEAHRARKRGTYNWSENRLEKTVRGCGYMALGFFGSFVVGAVWTVAAHEFHIIPRHLVLFFSVAPFATFAPCWLIVITRWVRRIFDARQREHERLERMREAEREKHEYERERESTTREYKKLVDEFAKLVSDGSSPWDEITRTAKVLHGDSTDFAPFKEVVENEIGIILMTFSIAIGNVPNGLGRLYQAILSQPDEHLTVKDCVKQIEYGQYVRAVELPCVVEPLSAFDRMRKTHLAADAATAYASLIIRASECCSASMPVDSLRIKYIELLKPYTSVEGFENGNQSPSGHQNGNASGTQFNWNCPECVKYFPVLRLKPDAGEEEIKGAHRNFAKIYHTDRFEGKSERQTAEEEMKQINEAYSHIIRHFKPTQP